MYMGWKAFWIWLGQEHRIQCLTFLWKLKTLLSSFSANTACRHWSALPVGPVPASCPWFMFFMLCLTMDQGHPHRRRAFREVFEHGDPSSLCPAGRMMVGRFLGTGNHMSW